MIGECEIIRDAVSILGRRTIVEEEGRGEGEEEEGVSVREKNGILGVVLEVVEAGGWKGRYEELEEVVGRLEEEGEKEWRERKGKREEGGMEWKEMGRLAREVGWEIEKRKRREEGEGKDGCMITLYGMKKNLADEKKRVDEERKGREEEKKRADEAMRLREEEKKGREEEKKKREEVEREKREIEERIRKLEQELQTMNPPLITSLDSLSCRIPSNATRSGNQLSGDRNCTCVFGDALTSVSITSSIVSCLFFSSFIL